MKAVSFFILAGALAPLYDASLAANAQEEQITKETTDSQADIIAYNESIDAYAEAARNHELERALSAARKALELGEKLSAVTPDESAKMALNIARIYVNLRKKEEAYAMYDRTIMHLTAAYGEHSREHFVPLQEHITFAIHLYDTDEAKAKFSDLSEVVTRNFDFPSKERALFALTEARLIRRQILSLEIPASGRNRTKIRDLMTKAFEDYLEVNDEVGCGEARFALGKFEMEARRNNKALEYLLEAVAHFDAAQLSSGDHRLLQSHTYIAQLYLLKGKGKKATPHIQYVGRHQGDIDRDDVVPLFRVAPKYPQLAIQRGLEGWVQLEFTITTSGTVTEIVVKDSDPPKIFDKAAKKAISKWRYAPKAINGKLVESQAEVVLTFEME